MKKVTFVLLASALVFGFSSCRTMNPKRIACNSACKTAKNKCFKKADKSKRAVVIKKKACDAAKSKCLEKCRKEF